MKLYGAPNPAPNPRRVRIFLAEKGIDLPETPLDLFQREHKSPEHVARNSRGQVPVLELDDGTMISETVSICRYFEETFPDPPLFGTGAVGCAVVDMWLRRVEFVVMTPVRNFWLHAHPRTAALFTQFKDFGLSNRAPYAEALAWLDGELAGGELAGGELAGGELAGKAFLAGETFTIADICALTTIDFATWIGLEIPSGLTALQDWHARVSARPSASA